MFRLIKSLLSWLPVKQNQVSCVKQATRTITTHKIRLFYPQSAKPRTLATPPVKVNRHRGVLFPREALEQMEKERNHYALIAKQQRLRAEKAEELVQKEKANGELMVHEERERCRKELMEQLGRVEDKIKSKFDSLFEVCKRKYMTLKKEFSDENEILRTRAETAEEYTKELEGSLEQCRALAEEWDLEEWRFKEYIYTLKEEKEIWELEKLQLEKELTLAKERLPGAARAKVTKTPKATISNSRSSSSKPWH